jgi:hypothetical protein
MRWSRVLVTSLFVGFLVAPAIAQSAAEPLSSMQAALACAPPPTIEGAAPDALRILGVQDGTARTTYGPPDLLVIGGGSQAGVQLGQQFFIRRPIRFGTGGTRQPGSIRTVGWIRIAAVNDTTAIATIEHVCDAIFQNDYLAPFALPEIPADAERVETSGEVDFTTLSRVVVGNENRGTGGAGDFMLMDRGGDQGITAGKRFAIYRDVGVTGMPLAALGEAVVMTVGKDMALVLINSSRAAVHSGDYLVPHK